jgi:hypothetical protein
MPYRNIVLAPHQQRVVDEKVALDAKLYALKSFTVSDLFFSLDIEERGRLTKQAEVMGEYSEILQARISAFLSPLMEAEDAKPR